MLSRRLANPDLRKAGVPVISYLNLQWRQAVSGKFRQSKIDLHHALHQPGGIARIQNFRVTIDQDRKCNLCIWQFWNCAISRHGRHEACARQEYRHNGVPRGWMLPRVDCAVLIDGESARRSREDSGCGLHDRGVQAWQIRRAVPFDLWMLT